MRLLIVIALLLAASCIDFEEAEKQYCSTHSLCSDGGTLQPDGGP